MFDTFTAFTQEKEINYQDDGEIIFAAPAKKRTNPVAPVVNELDAMAMDLVALRCTDADYEAPFAKLTDTQLEEFEEEKIGEDFSTHPYLF